MPMPLEQWTLLLHRSLATRLDPSSFSDFVSFLHERAPLPAQRLSNLFLSPTPHESYSLDPRAERYILVLLSQGLVTIPNVLRSLWKVSSFRLDGNGGPDEKEKEEKKIRWKSSYATEETLFYRLTKSISSGVAPKHAAEAIEVVKECIVWMEGVMAAVHAQGEVIALSQTRTAEINAQNMALGTLVVAVVENATVQLALSKGRIPRSTRQALSKTLATFVPLLLQTSPQSAARLEVFRTETMVALEPVDLSRKALAASKEIDEILEESMDIANGGLDSIVLSEMPVINSRAGLYIYLNALLVGRPLIDDNVLFSYLHNRYQGDIRSTIVDLIHASFDILANATFRNERQQATTIARSFLINKVPLLLTTLSSQLFPPLTSEFCITEALSQVDTTAFPTLSNMFDESSGSNMFSDSVRQDFCFACCLHGLIAESSIEDLLGDIPMQSLPAGGRYAKENLVQQCLSDPAKAEGLIDELSNMDGNVGAVSQAITEVISRLCTNKETISLKSLCSRLARKPSALDVMLLFDKATTILRPLCNLLDTWRYDEDQGEYQPVYEEFGAILLLVLSFTYRYNLSVNDLGIQNADSFIAKLLNQGHLSRPIEELSQQEQSHLTGWINGLFDPESGGLGDELMSSCPPQDFYLLVPTLFHAIVTAFSTRHLTEEVLSSGLEYLVDTFLLPSLIPGITWLSSHLWESRGDANAVLSILSSLIKNPTSISNNTEASQTLNSILNIVAKNLEHSLRWLQRAEPTRMDVEPLSKALRGNLGWETRGASEHTELETWTGTSGGGLVTAINHVIANLVQWGLNPTMNSHPSSYTHRLILVGLKMLGAKRVLNSILEEVKSQSETGNGGVVLDVATAIVAAPDSASWNENAILGAGGQPLQRRINLREALKYEAENAPKLQKTDAFHAETLVRLYRKVEAQLSMPDTELALDSAMDGVNIEAVAEGMDLTSVADGMGSMADLGGDLGGSLGMDSLGMDGMGMDMGGSDHADLLGDLMGGGRNGSIGGVGNSDGMDLLDSAFGGDGMGF